MPNAVGKQTACIVSLNFENSIFQAGKNIRRHSKGLEGHSESAIAPIGQLLRTVLVRLKFVRPNRTMKFLASTERRQADFADRFQVVHTSRLQLSNRISVQGER